ncbi:MAG TPA: xanthine dehydrogenase family protein molybdopterin-binding subunit [Burkholderiales bacterium]|jgi:carbon-monoxide dehydrogenase large subunit|nr:xanthine dehydrogenase family protein molybdopterin-binding subunit [Burkholderiales bacterium]
MAGSSTWIGQPVRRVEDDRLLRGQGKFLADVKIPGTLETVFVRSTHAHARIRGIDTRRALEAAGVVAVFTQKDIAGKTAPICVAGEAHTPERFLKLVKPLDKVHPTPLFPAERATYAGQPLAMVIADTLAHALDAAELVEVDYEPLPAVTDPKEALQEGAPLVEPEFGDNLVVSVAVTKGNPEEAFRRSDIVSVEEEIVTHRYVAAPLETRGIQALVDPVTGELTAWSSTQTAHILQTLMAVSLKMPTDRIRVVTCDVGGGFGQKGVQSAEDMLVAFAAKELSRPVRWVETRGENLTAAPHARDQVHRIALAATKDGRFVALRDDAIMNCGAYNFIGMVVPYNSVSHLLGPYDVPDVSIAVKGVLTHTNFTTPYRGAGRPEAVFAMERIVDRLAAKLGMEPSELRARNLVPKEAMPYDTGLLYRDGFPQVYDSGDFPELMRRAHTLARLEEFRRRQAEAAKHGRYLGIGFAMYVEGTGMGPFEGAHVTILPSGRVRIATGACHAGQGHRTTYGQVAAEVLRVPLESIEVVGGDTDGVAYGIGSIASRSAVNAGNAVHAASVLIRERILKIAAEMMEAAAVDLELEDGKVRLKGTDKAVSLAQVSREAAAAVLRKGAPGEAELSETAYFRPPTVTYASAANAAIVEVDADTGVVTVEKYIVVHDCGRVLNPLLADGQIAGGLMQGLGGVLCEEMVYDRDGQPLSGSFMDYAMPKAVQAPQLVLDHIESLSTRNPLGVKGLGEGGAIAPPAAIANAIEDALRPLGVVVRRGPFSPRRVRELIESVRRKEHLV